MSLLVTLDLPDTLVKDANQVVQQTEQPLEEVLLQWIKRGANDRPVELLADEQLLLIIKSQLPTEQQDELSDLLALNREEQLTPRQRIRLDELMHSYRQGLIRKAQALKEAVARGIQPPLREV